jgi:hypothetical protein
VHQNGNQRAARQRGQPLGMARAVALRRLVEDAHPGVVRRLPGGGGRAARKRNRLRPGEPPEIADTRGNHAQAVAAEDIDAAARRRGKLPAQADAAQAAQVGRAQPPRPGHDQGQLLQRALEAEMRHEMVAREQRQPQPQHVLGKCEASHHVDQAFRRKAQLELIPVARHRPFGREGQPEAGIGMDHAHGRPLPLADLFRGDKAKPRGSEKSGSVRHQTSFDRASRRGSDKVPRR